MDFVEQLEKQNAEYQEKKESDHNEDDDKEERKTQSQILIELTSDMAYFYDEQGETYARMQMNGHHEVWPIASETMELILIDRYMSAMSDKVPSQNSLKETISALKARARLRGNETTVHTRIAETDDAIYIDLCNKNWEAIEINKEGWSINSDPPVHFKRSKIMHELPYPKEKGSIDDLKPFINYETEDDYKLVVAWLLSTVKENNPFPILTLQGEQGSAKSTTSKILRSIIDPSGLPLRGLPTDEQTLAISANNTWLLAYDNLSGLSASMSDSLCKLSTGGGLSVRTLYTTTEESVFNIMRPSILNGIDDIAQRPDLLDRSIVINLPSISESGRKDEKTFWKNFNEMHSSVLGAMCDVISDGLNVLPNVSLSHKPRMADFAKWITACERSLGWYDGEFMDIYNDNRGKAIDQGLESDPFASAIIELLKQESEWIGNASQLLARASNFTDDRTTRSKAWPTSRSVRNRLRRINPSLKKKNIEYEPWESKKHRTLKLELIKTSSPSSPSSPNAQPQSLEGYDKGDVVKKGYDVSSPSYDDETLSSPHKRYSQAIGADGYDNDDKFKEYINEKGDLVI